EASACIHATTTGRLTDAPHAITMSTGHVAARPARRLRRDERGLRGAVPRRPAGARRRTARARTSGDPRVDPARRLSGRGTENPRSTGGFYVVGDTGIEPVTSSVSGKRATAAPIA